MGVTRSSPHGADHKHLKPKCIHDEDVLEHFAKDNMYLQAINFIKSVRPAAACFHSSAAVPRLPPVAWAASTAAAPCPHASHPTSRTRALTAGEARRWLQQLRAHAARHQPAADVGQGELWHGEDVLWRGAGQAACLTAPPLRHAAAVHLDALPRPGAAPSRPQRCHVRLRAVSGHVVALRVCVFVWAVALTPLPPAAHTSRCAAAPARWTAVAWHRGPPVEAQHRHRPASPHGQLPGAATRLGRAAEPAPEPPSRARGPPALQRHHLAHPGPRPGLGP